MASLREFDGTARSDPRRTCARRSTTTASSSSATFCHATKSASCATSCVRHSLGAGSASASARRSPMRPRKVPELAFIFAHPRILQVITQVLGETERGIHRALRHPHEHALRLAQRQRGDRARWLFHRPVHDLARLSRVQGGDLPPGHRPARRLHRTPRLAPPYRPQHRERN